MIKSASGKSVTYTRKDIQLMTSVLSCHVPILFLYIEKFSIQLCQIGTHA